LDEEGSIADIVSKPGLLAIEDYTPAYATSTWRVQPFDYYTSGSPPFTLTPLAAVASCFEYWRGDIVFHFTAVANAFVTGVVAASWLPDSTDTETDPNTLFEEYTSVSMNLSETREMELVVPYSAGRIYTSIANSTVTTSHTPNGLVALYSLVPLQMAGNAAPAIKVLVSMSGRQMEFARPSTRLIKLFTVAEAQGPGDDNVDEAAEDLVVQDSIATTMVNVGFDAFGERFTTLYDILKRPGVTFLYESVSTINATSIPVFNAFSQTGDISPGVSTQERWDFLWWLRLMFYGWRGSLRVRITPLYTAATALDVGPRDAICQYYMAFLDSTNSGTFNDSTNIGLQTYASTIALGLSMGAAESSYRNKNVVELEVPHLYPHYFIRSRCEDPTVLTRTPYPTEPRIRMWFAARSTLTSLLVTTSAGDSFRLYNFMRVPRVTFS
jgi:hypothetical protein